MLLLKQLAMLNDEVKNLETEAIKVGEPSARSPRQVPSHGLRGSATVGHRDLYSSTESKGARSVSSSGSRNRRGLE